MRDVHRRYGLTVAPTRLLLLTVALSIGAVACGSPDADTVAGNAGGGSPTPTSAPNPAAGGGDRAVTDLPDVEVVDLASGDTVNLQSLAAAGKPTLLWFWAPHCTFCMREAPELLAFADAHGDAVHILGIGARDDLDLAHEFVDRTDTDTLAMLWDPSGETWIHYGVTNQPTVVVLSPEGEVQGTWFRDFDEDGILAAAGLT